MVAENPEVIFIAALRIDLIKMRDYMMKRSCIPNKEWACIPNKEWDGKL